KRPAPKPDTCNAWRDPFVTRAGIGAQPQDEPIPPQQTIAFQKKATTKQLRRLRETASRRSHAGHGRAAQTRWRDRPAAAADAGGADRRLCARLRRAARTAGASAAGAALDRRRPA